MIFINKVAAKKKKKILYPKGFDSLNPGLMPDPERWIPKWQRRKHFKKYKARGAQGDSVNINKPISNKISTATSEASTGKKRRGK